MEQTILDLEKIPQQVLLDNINAKQDIIVFLIDRATIVNQALAGLLASKSVEPAQLTQSVNLLDEAIRMAARETNAANDKLLKFKKEDEHSNK